MIDRQIAVLVGAVSVMFVAVMIILTNNIASSNRNFEAIIESETEINHTISAVNNTVTDLIADAREARERDANLTKEETQKLVDDLRQIPNIAVSINKTLELIESKQPESNITAQREAVANIERMKDDMITIKGSVLSLDNKVNELFFFENRSSTPTR